MSKNRLALLANNDFNLRGVTMTQILNQIINRQTTIPEFVIFAGVFLIVSILILMLLKELSFKRAIPFLIGIIMITGLGLHMYKCQCTEQLKQITVAKEYPAMSIAKVSRSDYIFYFKKGVAHNRDNIIKNETGYEIITENTDDSGLFSDYKVNKIKPQAILARKIKENINTKNYLRKIVNGHNKIIL